MLMTIAFVAVAFVVGAVLFARYSAKTQRAALATMNATSPGVECGTFVSGHPEIVGSPGVTMSCNSHDFLLLGWNGVLLGRIPRHAVTSMDIIDKSKVVRGAVALQRSRPSSRAVTGAVPRRGRHADRASTEPPFVEGGD